MNPNHPLGNLYVYVYTYIVICRLCKNSPTCMYIHHYFNRDSFRKKWEKSEEKVQELEEQIQVYVHMYIFDLYT